MAAVVASLSVFLTGCGLPLSQPIGVTRENDQGRSLCSEDQDRPSSNVWREACEAATQGLHEPTTTRSVADSQVTKVPGFQNTGTVYIQALVNPPRGILRRRPTQGEPLRRVTFNLDVNTSHEITPYSEVYGMHPREFNFDKFMVKAMTSCFTQRKGSFDGFDRGDSDDEDESDEELSSLHAKALCFLTRGGCSSRSAAGRAFSRPCWFAMGAMAIMLRMFGSQVCLELLSEAVSLPKEACWGLLTGAL